MANEYEGLPEVDEFDDGYRDLADGDLLDERVRRIVESDLRMVQEYAARKQIDIVGLAALDWQERQCTGTRTLRMIRLYREFFLAGGAITDEAPDEIVALGRAIEKYGVGNDLDYTDDEVNDE